MNEEKNISNEEIKKMLEENFAFIQRIKEDTHYIKKYVVISQVMSFVKVFVIVVPIVLSILYLPKLLSNALSPYQELLGVSSGANLQEALKQVSPQLINQKK
ncbi:MAG: hypothetical protein Q7T50_03260 [Candidatus Magasanikbacteria bacterium]|nr:hypothetical protein [Candidatus Magasanikbacteria bacterium]